MARELLPEGEGWLPPAQESSITRCWQFLSVAWLVEADTSQLETSDTKYQLSDLKDEQQQQQKYKQFCEIKDPGVSLMGICPSVGKHIGSPIRLQVTLLVHPPPQQQGPLMSVWTGYTCLQPPGLGQSHSFLTHS